jgi:hypothetical protein
MDEGDFKEIEMMFKHQFGILWEDVQHKLDIVVEGHGILAEKLESTGDELKEEIQKVNQRLTMAEANLSKKINAISSDLAGHRGDTEIHRKQSSIRENKD